MHTIGILVFGTLLLSAAAAAAECDFGGATTGMCHASITIQNQVNSNGNSSADIVIKSSAECSKVSYRNGDLTETSFVRNGTSIESISSTTPISPTDMVVTSCQAFGPHNAETTDAPQETASDNPPEPKDGTLTGRWNSNHYWYWDLWEEDGKIIGTQVIQLDKTPTYAYMTGTHKGKTLTLKIISPTLEKLRTQFGVTTERDRVVNQNTIQNYNGNVTMTRQREQDLDRTVSSLSGHWTTLKADLSYSLTDNNGVIKGTGSSSGSWPDFVGDPKADAKVDLIVDGSRKANEVVLNVRDKSGKVTSARYNMRNDHSFWKDGTLVMIRQ
ncbi:hypothetical protein [Rhizobium sp. BK176]|uniref:hypothetical protein n=1 Tax=Rhizobium sp. BK176 TaxID=2587071 RepID=UPI002167952C|nr:hypothetical protein [Rhizobium sp. BK176]MCS4088929.1 hypothetical protein [Rhizobium sp. BK176]